MNDDKKDIGHAALGVVVIAGFIALFSVDAALGLLLIVGLCFLFAGMIPVLGFICMLLWLAPVLIGQALTAIWRHR